jgi:hypothetical protein
MLHCDHDLGSAVCDGGPAMESATAYGLFGRDAKTTPLRRADDGRTSFSPWRRFKKNRLAMPAHPVALLRI